MIVKQWFAALAAGVVVMAAACGPSGNGGGAEQNGASKLRAELLAAETSGEAAGELYRALREAEPELYDYVLSAAGAEIAQGKSAFEAGVAARPRLLARFLELVKTAQDEHVNELLALSHAQMAEALTIAPEFCVNLSQGAPDPRINRLPKVMQDREFRLMAAVIAAGPQAGAVGTQEDLDAWAGGYVASRPDIVEGLMLIGAAAPTTEEARKICEANIGLLDGFIAEEPAQRARLFRATLAAS